MNPNLVTNIKVSKNPITIQNNVGYSNIYYPDYRWKIRSKHDLTPAISRIYLDSPIWQTNTESPTILINKMHSLCKLTMELSNSAGPLKFYMITNHHPFIWSTWLRRNICLHQWKRVDHNWATWFWPSLRTSNSIPNANLKIRKEQNNSIISSDVQRVKI